MKKTEELTAKKSELERQLKAFNETSMAIGAERNELYTHMGRELFEKVFKGKDIAKKREEWQKAMKTFADEKDWESYSRIKWEFPDFITSRIMSAGLSVEERMLLAKHLHDDLDQLLQCGTWGFGNYADESDCYSYQAATRNLGKLGLMQFTKSHSQCSREIPFETLEEMLIKILQRVGRESEIKNLEQRSSSNSEKMEAIHAELKQVNVELYAYNRLTEALEKKGLNIEAVEMNMPEFISFLGSVNSSYITANSEKRVGVILEQKQWDSKSAGMEYGVNVIVWRDGKTEKAYFKYRDAYNASGDAWHLSFNEASIVKVTKDKVTVELRSNDYKTTRTFNLAESNEKTVEEITDKEFLKMYSAVKKGLVETHTRKTATMPDYIDYTFAEGTMPLGTTSGRRVPYEKAEVIDECVKGNKAVVIVRAQIDHGGGHGKQYEWVAYKVTKEGKEQIARDTLWDLQAKHGKRVEMKAAELIEK